MPKEAPRRLIFILVLIPILLLFAIPATARAQGGPPLIVDDPDTPGPGFWEINIANIVENTRTDHHMEAPLADINYGVGNRIQLKLEFPWLRLHPEGESVATGLGNTLVGVKWRFLGQEGKRVAWSTYPQLEIPTGHSLGDQGLIAKNKQFLLPTEITLQFGGLEINGEVGRNFVQSGPNEWSYGVSSELSIRDEFLEIVGELAGERVDGASTNLIVDIGARQRLTRQIYLLGAVGTGVHGPSDDRLRLRVYAGLTFLLPYKFRIEKPSRGK
jgi:hypothetical protein